MEMVTDIKSRMVRVEIDPPNKTIPNVNTNAVFGWVSRMFASDKHKSHETYSA
jgi:hypothetical protein